MRIWCCFFSLALLAATQAIAEEQPPAATEVPQPTAQVETIKKLIEKLNAPDNIAREDAERELMRVGHAALPLLKEAVKSPEPEIAARAKRLVSRMAELISMPARSYAETLPGDALFFVELPHAAQTLETLKATPLGKLWRLPAAQKFYKGHYNAQLPSDQHLLDGIGEISKLIAGRALMYIGPADSADAAELDPPVVYLLETKEPQRMEGQVRALFESLQDPCKSTRRYGPFTIDEHITAQSLFGQQSVLHALTQRAIECFLDNRLNKPATTLDTQLAGIRALLPKHDLVLHAARHDFDTLLDAAQLVDEEMVKGLDTYGLIDGTVCQAVVAANTDGFEEYVRLMIPDAPPPSRPVEKSGDAHAAPDAPMAGAPKSPAPDTSKVEKHPALMALLKEMHTVVPEANKPAALDLIPWQSGVVLSFNGDVSNNALALSQALRDVDALRTPPPARNPHKPPALPETHANPAGVKEATPAATAPKNNAIPNTPGRQALAEGAGAGAIPQPAPDPNASKKPAAPAPNCPMIARFEKIGIKFEQFLSLIDGPMHVALFPHQVGNDYPETLPLSPLVAVCLKDPAQVEQSLDAAATGPAPRYRREVLNGGSHYIDITCDNPSGAGFWLKGNYLAYSTERDLLDLAGLAAIHANGNERIADRAAYKRAIAARQLPPDALLNIFAESDQVLEMPYRLAQINWQEDDANPWPDWTLVKPLVQGKPILISVKSIPGGLQAWGQTPLTIYGTALAFRWPLLEADYIKQ